MGVIMEGLGYNPIVYDFVGDMIWRNEPPDLNEWTRGFARRRYGCDNEHARQAWALLLQSAYTATGRTDTVICSRPGLTPTGSWRRGVPYDIRTLHQAWEKLLSAGEVLGDRDTYQFDLVNVTRQILGELAGDVHADVVEAYERRDRRAMSMASTRFLLLIRDMDALLATRPEFLLGRWLEDARRWGTNPEGKRLHEWNARNVITLWGEPDSAIHDYANKQWSGMLTGFYLSRWAAFFQQLTASLAGNKPFDAEGFEQGIRRWELAWTRRTESHPTQPQGDAVAVARRLYDKYHRVFDAPERSLMTSKPATCSHALPGHPASHANDGRFRSSDRYWATDVGADKQAWWQVDLGKRTTVGRVVVIGYYRDGRHYGFTVEASMDGEAWEVVADRRDNKEPSRRRGYTCRFEPRSVRYLRVNMTHNSANTGRHLVEVMAFAK